MTDTTAVSNRKRTEKTVAVVNRWYIPGGYMYDQARVINVFFDSMEEAKKYQEEYRYPPEMADLITIQEHDNFLVSTSKGYQEYKKRYYAEFKDKE